MSLPSSSFLFPLPSLRRQPLLGASKTKTALMQCILLVPQVSLSYLLQIGVGGTRALAHPIILVSKEINARAIEPTSLHLLDRI